MIHNIEHNQKQQRKQGFNRQQGMLNLVKRYFRISWPRFFTTLLLCLDPEATQELRNIGYVG